MSSSSSDKNKYYWIKLSTKFLTSNTVDFLMSQSNGAKYVVLYQILCLMSVNTNGRLANQIGEVIIPYDIEKIKREAKWFDLDTIRVALTLFKRLGLIYEEDNGVLTIVDYERLVGCETQAAQRQREYRNSLKKIETK